MFILEYRLDDVVLSFVNQPPEGCEYVARVHFYKDGMNALRNAVKGAATYECKLMISPDAAEEISKRWRELK
jgi:hypothetical protein